MTPTPQPQETVTKDSAAPLCEGDNEKLCHLVAALEMYGKHGGTLISREDAAVVSDLLDRAMKRIAALSADQDTFPVAYVAPASLGALSAAAKAGRYEYVDAGSLPGHDAVALYTKAQPQEADHAAFQIIMTMSEPATPDTAWETLKSIRETVRSRLDARIDERIAAMDAQKGAGERAYQDAVVRVAAVAAGALVVDVYGDDRHRERHCADLIKVLARAGNASASTCGTKSEGRSEPKPSTREVEAPVSEAVAWRDRFVVSRDGKEWSDWEYHDDFPPMRPTEQHVEALYTHPAPSPASAWKPERDQVVEFLSDWFENKVFGFYDTGNGTIATLAETTEFDHLELADAILALPTPPATEGAGDE